MEKTDIRKQWIKSVKLWTHTECQENKNFQRYARACREEGKILSSSHSNKIRLGAAEKFGTCSSRKCQELSHSLLFVVHSYATLQHRERFEFWPIRAEQKSISNNASEEYRKCILNSVTLAIIHLLNDTHKNSEPIKLCKEPFTNIIDNKKKLFAFLVPPGTAFAFASIVKGRFCFRHLSLWATWRSADTNAI